MIDSAGAWNHVEPQGLAVALLITALSFAVLTTVVMGMRIFIRLETGQFGIEDWVMLAGYLINLGQCVLAIYGSYSGIGTMDRRLNQATRIEGLKAVLMWQTFYAGSLAFIKSSICINLMRIAQQRLYLNILRGLVILSVALSCAGFVIVFNQCHPLDRYWDKRVPGRCWSPMVATALSYTASVSNVIIDLSVATIPVFLLRHVKLQSRLKLYIRLILGLGMLASVASIIRVPFSNAYMKVSNKLYYTGNIVLWTIVECGLGIIAGSLPMLRVFFKLLASDKCTHDSRDGCGPDLVVARQIRVQQCPMHNPNRLSTAIAAASTDINDDPIADRDGQYVRVTRDILQMGSKASLEQME